MSNLPPKAPYKQVIVIRKDLNMRKGKIAAQAAHASLSAILEGHFRNEEQYTLEITLDETLKNWLDGSFKKICVYVNSEAELQTIYDKAVAKELRASIITDRGDTEFHGVPTKTAVAIGPAMDADVDEITGGLPLL